MDADRVEPELEEVEEILGHRFADASLLRQALRHGSATAGVSDPSYERLEFLGDAVLGHAVAELLFRRFPGDDQGVLTRKRAHLIRSEALAAVAADLGLDRYIEVGPSEERNHGRERTALLEDVLEALIGALALDGGWEAAAAFIRRQLGDEVDELDERTLALANPKSVLQEAAQGRGLQLPEYREVQVRGTDHRPLWVFAVLWDGEEIARGEGTSKRQAQQQAARRALERLGLVPGG